MKSYFADTNFYLRFILDDVKSQSRQTATFLTKAKNKQLQIIFCSEVILEMEFVLRRVYLVPKNEIIKTLKSLVKTDYLDIEDRNIWIETLKLYTKRSISLFDSFLYTKAKAHQAQILTYDADLKRIKD